jgi:hypothetical protein
LFEQYKFLEKQKKADDGYLSEGNKDYIDDLTSKEEEGGQKELKKEKPNPKGKRIKIALGIGLAVIILLIGGYTIYVRYFRAEIEEKNNPKITPTISAPPAEQKTQSPLDGTMAPVTTADRHPLAIIIENHPDARPQSGLDKASIIYEAITEGGITRFMAVYGPYDSDKVGPVRSARTFFVDWAEEFDAFLAHVGGNLDALEKIKADQVKDLDQFRYGNQAYQRIPSGNKAKEHIMYTSTEKLYKIAQNNKWDQRGVFDSYQFKEELALEKRSTSLTINLPFSSSSYNVSWSYDRENNLFLRKMGGVSHKDAQTGIQLKAKNICVQYMDRWPAPTSIGEEGWAMKTVGEGKAMVFMDGQKIDATWKKTSSSTRTMFYDNQQQEIKFNPGQFWIEIVPPETKITTE